MHSTHRRGWSTSTTENAESKAAASYRFSELRVRKRWNTVQGIPWTGWCKSKTESAEPNGATKSRRWELSTQERQSTVHTTPDHNAVSKDSGRERLAHTTPGRKPLLTYFRVSPYIQAFASLPPRQVSYRVLAGTLVSEDDTGKLHLRRRSELSHESRLPEW